MPYLLAPLANCAAELGPLLDMSRRGSEKSRGDVDHVNQSALAQWMMAVTCCPGVRTIEMMRQQKVRGGRSREEENEEEECERERGLLRPRLCVCFIVEKSGKALIREMIVLSPRLR